MKNIIQKYRATKTIDEVKLHQPLFPVDTSFVNTLFMDTPYIEKSHGGSLNHWVGGLMHITLQTHFDLQYLTMLPSGYINAPTEPDFLALKHVVE